ncbi:blaR1 [Gossypium arboreum]|uniref:BlaR1 n=1 Tax=Gossypium arboreum TaxID=29729 RepID=A0A0B0MU54_GOSAR|nr:blaR1 [Gossypium arboreum]
MMSFFILVSLTTMYLIASHATDYQLRHAGGREVSNMRKVQIFGINADRFTVKEFMSDLYC